MIKKYKDIFVGAFYMLFGAALFIAAQSITAFVNAPLGPEFMPKLIAIVMFFIGILVLNGGIKVLKNYEASQDVDETKPSLIRLAITFALMCCYVYFLQSIGFILTTFAYIIAQVHLVTAKEFYNIKLLVKVIVISAVTSVSLYYLFYYVFQVFLPKGIWF